MVTAEQIRRAADILKAQHEGGGPVLGFSFDGQNGGVTLDYDERRDVVGMCLHAFAEALNEAVMVPERPVLAIVREV